MLGNLIGGFVVILVGVALMPSIADGVNSAIYENGTVGNQNVTGASATILEIVPLFFALGIMASGASLALGGLRNAGLI